MIIQFKLLHEMEIEKDRSSSDFELSHHQHCASATAVPQSQFYFESSSQYANLRPKKGPRNGKRAQGEIVSNRHSKAKNWTAQQQLEYFYAVIQYSIKYPCMSLSWGEWKQNRFYNYVSDHFEGAKTIKQCKTKDQNLKKKYYLVEKGRDMLQVSRIMLEESVFTMYRLALQGRLSDEDYPKLQKYEALLKDARVLDASRLSKTYEEEMSCLMVCIENDMWRLEDLITAFP